MSMEECEIMEEAYIRVKALDDSLHFDPLIAFLRPAMADNQRAFNEGKSVAREIQNQLKRRRDYGI